MNVLRGMAMVQGLSSVKVLYGTVVIWLLANVVWKCLVCD